MTPEELTKLAKHHDWYYMMSDDHGVWRRGKAAKGRLYAAFKNHPDQEEAKRIWDEYAPQDFSYFDGRPRE